MMTPSTPTPYDTISYPGHPYVATHPDRLATVGTLYGMEPVPASRCRFLELGCGVGGNLLPMAAQYPGSEFLGIDLSLGEIEKGQRNAAHYGLANVSLRQADIAEIGEDWGRFDYIVAHGVYSWVPPSVREAMLRIFSRNLNPQGIAYLSYNAHPGSRQRDMVRDIMNFHVRDFTDPKQRTSQARAILNFVAEGSDKTTVYGAVLRDQLERVRRMGDEVLYHDDLNVIASAFLLHEVAADAKRHGLQYLSDAVPARRDLSRYSDTVREVLERFPDDEFLARDQFQDFIDGHGFRSTLLCHGVIALQRKLSADLLARFHLECSSRAVDPAMDPNAPGVAEFKLEAGHIMGSDHALTKAALRELGLRWPGAVAYDALIERALVATAVSRAPGSVQEDIAGTTHVLFREALRGHIMLHREPPPIAGAVSERPVARALARKQAELGNLVSNLQHRPVRLEDERVRRLVMLTDGTRDLDQLVAALQAACADLPPGTEDQPIDRPTVQKRLEFLVELALLEG